jgi:hypothetical protein
VIVVFAGLMDSVASAPAVNVTVPPVTATGVRSDKVFISAVVEARVQFDTPAALEEQAPLVLFDPLAEKVGVTPETGLPFVSFNVIVIVDVEIPFAVTGLVPLIVELAATGTPGVNVTVAVCEIMVPSVTSVAV